ncbi:unnamed protein product [Absidia cylindrospora]
MTQSSIKSQEPFLYKLKSGLSRFINRRRHSSIVHTFRPSKHHHQYSPTRQDSFDTQERALDNNYYDENDTDDDGDDLDSSSITRVNSELQHSAYSKDDDFERNRYNGNRANSQHQHSRRPSAISIQSPPSILVKRSPTPSSHHRHTKSLQNASIISLPNSNNNGRPAHYHHSRNYSHISCISATNMTVNSEDLTAKEFADMAGIKIIPDDDDDEPDDNNGATSTMATSITSRTQQQQQQRQHPPISSASSIVTTTNGGQRPCYFSYHAGDENDWSVVSSGSMQSQQSGSAKIWDTGFWKRPNMDNNIIGDGPTAAGTNSTLNTGKPPLPPQQQQHPLLPPLPANGKTPPLRKHRSALLQHRQTLSLPPPIPPMTNNKIQCQHAKSKSTCDLPIVDELRRIHSMSNNNNQKPLSNNTTDHRVIRKGRFEIQLESSSLPPPPSSSTIDTKSTSLL